MNMNTMNTTTPPPTPETDAIILTRNGFGLTQYEWREHGRRLERERDEAREQLQAMRKTIKEAWIEINYAESGFAGLALRVCPNDSAVDLVLSRMTAALTKLQPFIKP